MIIFPNNQTDANICKRIISKRPQRQTKVKHLLHPFHISERSLFNWHNIALIITHRNYLPPAVNRRPGFLWKSSATIKIQYQSNKFSKSKIPTFFFLINTRFNNDLKCSADKMLLFLYRNNLNDQFETTFVS